MCVKLPFGDLNPDSYLLHPTSIYTCEVTTVPRVRVDQIFLKIVIVYTHLINSLTIKPKIIIFGPSSPNKLYIGP